MTKPEEGDERTSWDDPRRILVDDTRELDLSIAHVELPDGIRFEQYVLRMPEASIVVAIDESADDVLMICAARELEEETGWRSDKITPLGRFQPLSGTADFENHLFLAEDCKPTGTEPDINEAARSEWVPLTSAYQRIASGEIMGAAAQIGLLHVLARCH